MNDLGKVVSATAFAARCHAGQFRKGNNTEPYINHAIGVADLLVSVAKVNDADVVAAALLHDTVEDCGAENDSLAGSFGRRVAAIVAELTDDKSLPEKRRKELQVEHAPNLSNAAKLVKLADKISNINDITDNPPAGWSRKRRLEYVEWGVRVAAGLRGVNSELEKRFDEVIARARESVGRD